MDGGLAARQHHHLGLAFRPNEGIEARLHLLEGQRETLRVMAGPGEADRAVEVAMAVDLEDAEAGMLLVIRAQPAVQGATPGDLGLGLQRDRARLVEAHGLEVPVGTGVQQRFEAAVVGAALPQVQLVVPDVDLRVGDDLADRADALGVLDEDLVAVDPAVHRGGSSLVEGRLARQVGQRVFYRPVEGGIGVDHSPEHRGRNPGMNGEAQEAKDLAAG